MLLPDAKNQDATKYLYKCNHNKYDGWHWFLVFKVWVVPNVRDRKQNDSSANSQVGKEGDVEPDIWNKHGWGGSNAVEYYASFYRQTYVLYEMAGGINKNIQQNKTSI